MRANSQRSRRRAALATVVASAAALGLAAPASAAGSAPGTAGAKSTDSRTANTAGICEIRTGVSHTDHTGKKFTTDLYCENRVADVYAEPENYATVIGKLTSTLSWFVCWETGELHAGGNRIWYYTQGDKILNWPQRKAWGYVPAYYLTTTTDPYAGLPPCVPGRKKDSP